MRCQGIQTNKCTQIVHPVTESAAYLIVGAVTMYVLMITRVAAAMLSCQGMHIMVCLSHPVIHICPRYKSHTVLLQMANSSS